MIQQIIESIVSELVVENGTDAPTFIHGPKGWNNLTTDEIKNVVIILIEPVTSQDVLIGAHLQEKYPLLLAFLEKSELEYSPEQELVFTDRMRRLRAKFVYKCSLDSRIREIENIVTSDEFKVKDACLSGVGLQITITPVNGPVVC